MSPGWWYTWLFAGRGLRGSVTADMLARGDSQGELRPVLCSLVMRGWPSQRLFHIHEGFDSHWWREDVWSDLVCCQRCGINLLSQTERTLPKLSVESPAKSERSLPWGLRQARYICNSGWRISETAWLTKVLTAWLDLARQCKSRVTAKDCHLAVLPSHSVT
jgi:hypothetical protein